MSNYRMNAVRNAEYYDNELSNPGIKQQPHFVIHKATRLNKLIHKLTRFHKLFITAGVLLLIVNIISYASLLFLDTQLEQSYSKVNKLIEYRQYLKAEYSHQIAHSN